LGKRRTSKPGGRGYETPPDVVTFVKERGKIKSLRGDFVNGKERTRRGKRLQVIGNHRSLESGGVEEKAFIPAKREGRTRVITLGEKNLNQKKREKKISEKGGNTPFPAKSIPKSIGGGEKVVKYHHPRGRCTGELEKKKNLPSKPETGKGH